MSAVADWRALLGARVRFMDGNDVVEGEVVVVGPHLVKVHVGDQIYIVDRYSIATVPDA